MDNNQILENFYTAFAEGNAEKMISYYSDHIVFTDPAFGTLEGNQAKSMWKMLLNNPTSNSKIEFGDIRIIKNMGFAKWTATYNYGPKKRKVVNNVTGKFVFENGKITQHIDDFSLWNWSRQALGLSGYLLGWSNFMKNKIQGETSKKLNNYMSSSN